MSGIATTSSRAVTAVLAAALTAGCSAGGGGVVPDRPPRDLAATPATLPPGGPPPASATGSAAPAGSATAAPAATGLGANAGTATSGPAQPPAPGPAGTTLPPTGPFRRIGHADDRAGDPEGAGPAYADLRSVEIADDGRYARLTLTMAGPLPARVGPDETFGAGVDLYRSIAQVESDYQVFVDGSPDGWFAYLHAGGRYVSYPGTFAMGGSTIVFTLPWSALGGQRSGRFGGFADWTRDAPGDNPFSEDHAPDLATAAYG